MEDYLFGKPYSMNIAHLKEEFQKKESTSTEEPTFLDPSQNHRPLTQKEMIQSIIQDEFDIKHSNDIIDATIDFEDALYNEFYLKMKREDYDFFSKHKILRLTEIIRKHSVHYHIIKDKVHKNKYNYISSYFSK